MNNNYNEIYKKLINNKSNQLINLNNLLVKRFMLIIINITLMYLIISYSSIIHVLLYALIPLSITLIILIFLCIIEYKKKQTKYESLYEENIIKPLLKEIKPDISISNDKIITQELYDEAEFEHYSNPIIFSSLNKYIIFTSKVGMCGTINNRNIQISYIEIRKDVDIAFLNFIFCYVKLNYNYYENPIRLRHVNDREQNIVYKKEKINLNNNILNNNYNVFTTDPVTANKVFDSINNQKIIEMYNKNINNPFEITLKEDKLYIRIVAKNAIKLAPQKNPYNPNSIKELYDFLQYIFDISTLFIEIIDKK